MHDRPALQRKLEQGVAGLGLALPQAAIERLLDYLDLLIRWNKAYNLTAVRDPAEMVSRHLLDSLALLPFVQGATLADLGSGAGLPGIPLAIAAPDRTVILIDSNGKKSRFLREAARALDLVHVRVEQVRVETAAGTYACITARAFAALGDMLTWGGHLLAHSGIWLAMKGRIEQAELDAVPAGFRVEAVHALAVPGVAGERHLVAIRHAPD